MKEKLPVAKDSRMFYSYVQTLLGENEPTKWHVGMLDQEKTEEEMAEYMADFFNAISSEFSPLDENNIPVTFSTELPVI